METDTAPAPAAGPAPGPTPEPGTAPVVTALSLNAASVPPGVPVTAGVSLDRPAPPGTQVELAWVTQAAFNAANTSGTPIPPGDIHLLTAINIAAGASTGSGPFLSPSIGSGPVVILADAGSGGASASLNIT